MPASPGCSVRISSSSWRRGSSFGAIRYWMLGRSKLATKCWAPAASVRLSRLAISAWVASVAVAVSAMRGTSGQRSCSWDRAR